jgi:hypothetical protein
MQITCQPAPAAKQSAGLARKTLIGAHVASRAVDTIPCRMLQREEGFFAATYAEMVSVAQLVERQTVDLDVAGSNPVAHPKSS